MHLLKTKKAPQEVFSRGAMRGFLDYGFFKRKKV
jgi:hypothetical protein